VTGILWGALGVLAMFGMTAIGDMVSEEVRDRLDHVPQAILRLAARRLDPDEGSALYEEVWLPDLAYYLRGDKARPVTRLVHGTWYAIGIYMSADRIIRNLRQPVRVQSTARGSFLEGVAWLLDHGLDEQIAGGRSIVTEVQAHIKSTQAGEVDGLPVDRWKKDLAASQLILDNLLARKRWVERHRSEG
jgi:hypothetical protein